MRATHHGAIAITRGDTASAEITAMVPAAHHAETPIMVAEASGLHHLR